MHYERHMLNKLNPALNPTPITSENPNVNMFPYNPMGARPGYMGYYYPPNPMYMRMPSYMYPQVEEKK